MERKKSKIIELPELEAEVLQLCLFEESFLTILDEVSIEKRPGIVADAIKNLLHLKLLIPTNKQNSLTWIYDSDRMSESSFKATAKGVEWMENQAKLGSA